jgi:hypothetical protein
MIETSPAHISNSAIIRSGEEMVWWNYLGVLLSFCGFRAAHSTKHLEVDDYSTITVSRHDHITSTNRVAIVYSGFMGEGPIPWQIPSYEETISNSETSYPMCHLRFYGVTLEEHMNPLPKTGLATLFYETIPVTSIDNFKPSLQTTCYYLTNQDTYTDLTDNPKTLAVILICPIQLKPFCTSLEGNSFAFTINFHRNSSDPSLVSYFTSTLTSSTPPPISGAQPPGQQPQDAVCTVQVYENEVSGVKLLSWSLYHLSLSYVVLIYDRYAMHASVIAPLLSQERYRGRLFYLPFTVFQTWNPAMYNSLQRQRQVLTSSPALLIDLLLRLLFLREATSNSTPATRRDTARISKPR